MRDRRLALTVDHERRRDHRLARVVQVAPPFLPFRVPLLPPEALARQQEFQAFGEARLARPIAADDQRQAWLGPQVEGVPRPDAPESLDADAREKDAREGRSG